MGLRQRLGSVRDLTRKILDGARAVHEEANHPGRPPAHKVSTNPFYEEPAPKATPPSPVQPEPASEDAEELPWYLKGEVADPGWDQTNPGTEPGKKWP